MATKIMGLVGYNVVWAEAYLRSKWHLDPSSRLATIRGAKSGGLLCPFLVGSDLGPHLTQCGRGRELLNAKFHLDPSVHPTVWPQYTNVTDRQTDRTENGPIALGEPFLPRDAAMLARSWES